MKQKLTAYWKELFHMIFKHSDMTVCAYGEKEQQKLSWTPFYNHIVSNTATILRLLW